MSSAPPPTAPVVVTGGGGFVGQALCRAIAGPHSLRLVSRRLQGGTSSAGTEVVQSPDAGDMEAWREIVRGASAVVHLAARVHLTGEKSNEMALLAYRRSNATATLNLARAAADAGVPRFIFTSTSQVHGDRSDGEPLREDSPLRPLTPYARSKAEAEEGLDRIAESTGLDVTVFRPAMVYGPGVGGNFRRLRTLVEAGVPLPLDPRAGRRSVLYLGNLLDAIQARLRSKWSKGTYLIADIEPLTVSSLVAMMFRATHRAPRIMPVPAQWLRALAVLLGRREEIDKLTLPFELSIDRLRNERGWTPPFSTSEGIRCTMLADSR